MFLFCFFKRSFNTNSIEKRIGKLAKTQGSDPANPYTHPNSLKGPAVPLQKSKAKPLLAAAGAGAAPQRSCRTGFPRARPTHPSALRSRSCPVRGTTQQPLPTASCTVVNAILFKGLPCLSQAGTSLHSTPCSLPICLNVYSQKENRKAQKSEPHRDPSVINGDNWRRRGQGRGGGDCFNPSLFIKQKNKWSQVAYVIMMNNIQSTCIAIIIKHVFVVQVKI